MSSHPPDVALAIACHVTPVLQKMTHWAVDLDLLVVGEEDSRVVGQLVREVEVTGHAVEEIAREVEGIDREVGANAIDAGEIVVVSETVARGNAIYPGGRCHTSCLDHHNPCDLFESHHHPARAATSCLQWPMVAPCHPGGHLYGRLYDL